MVWRPILRMIRLSCPRRNIRHIVEFNYKSAPFEARLPLHSHIRNELSPETRGLRPTFHKGWAVAVRLGLVGLYPEKSSLAAVLSRICSQTFFLWLCEMVQPSIRLGSPHGIASRSRLFRATSAAARCQCGGKVHVTPVACNHLEQRSHECLPSVGLACIVQASVV